jgi:citrate synthase
VLLANHELNASTFAPRIAASTGASVATCLLVGLSILSGPRHGGACGTLLQLVDEAAGTSPEQAVLAWLDRDGTLPGFGHPLYPNGDVRALALLQRQRPDPLMQRLQECVLDATETLPKIDFALSAFAPSANIPNGAPFKMPLLSRALAASRT